MKYGLFTCPYQFLSLEDAFRDAKQYGYDFIELWGGRPHAYAPDLLKRGTDEIQRLIRQYEMPVKVYTPEHNAYPYNYMIGDEGQWKDCMDYLTAGLKVSKELGAEYMLISIGHGGNASYETRMERLERSLRYLEEKAALIGQKIVLETLTAFESNTCTRLKEYRQVMEEIRSPYLKAMVDVVVPFTQGEDPMDYLRSFGEDLVHIHLVDSDGVSDDHLIPGDGIMDLKTLIKEIENYGYRGNATIELVTHYINDPPYYAELALKKMKELSL